jgi:hypothetical protein
MMITAESNHALGFMMLTHRPLRIKVMPREVWAPATVDRAPEADLICKGRPNRRWWLPIHSNQPKASIAQR